MIRRVFLAAFLLGALATPAAAQPAVVTGLSANPARTMNFSWLYSAGATWYYLWVTDSSGVPRHRVWHTASQVNCGAGQSSLCQVNLSLYLLPGNGTWWVQPYSEARGYGGWSAAQTFLVPGPLFAVVDSDGTLRRGNAVSVTPPTDLFSPYEVVFARDVRNCAYSATIGSAAAGWSDFGMVRVRQHSTNARAVVVDMIDWYGYFAWLPFHLNVVCH